MQAIFYVGLIALFVKRNIADMLNGVYCVIPSFNTARSIGFSTQTSCDLTHLNRQNTSLELTVLVEHDLVIEFSTIYMSHHEHFATIIVGIRGVICELPVCECRLTFLFSTLRFVVAEFSTISALDRVVLSVGSACSPFYPRLLLACLWHLVGSRICAHGTALDCGMMF